jgi:hypothetical protein
MDTMMKQFLVAFAAGTIAFGPLPASAGGHAFSHWSEAAAVEACLAINEYGPAEAVETVEDGIGDFLVWVEDQDQDLWLCNADAEGSVYLNAMMEGDLLEGAGGAIINADTGSGSPAEQAESICLAVLNYGLETDGVVTASVEDGLGDYLVWLEDEDAMLYACNASSTGAVFLLEPIDMPLDIEAFEDEIG